jgi:steroid delta-isomerase-like uncharacterized protein
MKYYIIPVSLFMMSLYMTGSHLYAQGAPTNSSKRSTNEKMENTFKNKAAIRNLYEGILNTRKLDLLNEIISEDYTGVRGEKGPRGFADNVSTIISAFPDIKWTIEDLMADNDKVIVRWTWEGTNKNPFRGLPASGKKVHDHAIAIYQFSGEKVTYAWIESDRLGFLQQIGLVPADITSPGTNRNPSSKK